MSTHQFLIAVKIWLLLAQWLLAGAYEASFRVACQEGNATAYGSSTAISDKHLVTNAHVVGNAAGGWVNVFNGTASHRGYVIAADTNVDLALIHVAAGGLHYIPVASVDPKQGDAVTIYGFGRQGVLRSGEAIVQPIRSMRAAGCPVVETDRGIEPGDSGGGMFNAAGELCAVQWCSDGSNGNGAGHSGATPVSCLWALTQKWETQCGNGQCLPWSQGRGIAIGGYRYGGQQPARPLVPVQPPAQRPQPPAQPQPQLPAQPVAPACQCDNAAIAARLDKLELLGPKLDALAVQIANVKACECGPQLPPPTTPADAEHVVIIADKSSRDWPRLAGYIDVAKQHFSGLRVSDLPPFPIGVIPQAVVYREGVPVKTVKGRGPVERLLDDLRREKAPTL